MAMQLIRQSWKNDPLSTAEAAQLDSVVVLSCHAPDLKLLAHELLLSTTQLSHLYEGASPPPDKPTLNPDAGIGYLKSAAAHIDGAWEGFGPNPRALLTPLEEQRVLGMHPRPASTPFWLKEMRQSGKSQLRVPPCPVSAECVASVEAQLSFLVRFSSSKGVLPPYPLSSSNSTSMLPLEKEMNGGLQASWKTWHTLPKAHGFSMNAATLQAHIKATQVCIDKDDRVEQPLRCRHATYLLLCMIRVAVEEGIKCVSSAIEPSNTFTLHAGLRDATT